jgi:hypothetical protein
MKLLKFSDVDRAELSTLLPPPPPAHPRRHSSPFLHGLRLRVDERRIIRSRYVVDRIYPRIVSAQTSRVSRCLRAKHLASEREGEREREREKERVNAPKGKLCGNGFLITELVEEGRS